VALLPPNAFCACSRNGVSALQLFESTIKKKLSTGYTRTRADCILAPISVLNHAEFD
jgi:hypothetical protein